MGARHSGVDGQVVKPRIVKLRSGFLATTVPGSETSLPGGARIGEPDEFSRLPTTDELDKPLAELFVHVPQEPLSENDGWDIWYARTRSLPDADASDGIEEWIG